MVWRMFGIRWGHLLYIIQCNKSSFHWFMERVYIFHEEWHGGTPTAGRFALSSQHWHSWRDKLWSCCHQDWTEESIESGVGRLHASCRPTMCIFQSSWSRHPTGGTVTFLWYTSYYAKYPFCSWIASIMPVVIVRATRNGNITRLIMYRDRVKSSHLHSKLKIQLTVSLPVHVQRTLLCKILHYFFIYTDLSAPL